MGLPTPTLNDANIVAAWYLGPFDTYFDEPLRFAWTTSLEVGTELTIYNASYDNHEWIEMGTAIVQEDGIAYSAEESGIGILSTLLFVQQ